MQVAAAQNQRRWAAHSATWLADRDPALVGRSASTPSPQSPQPIHAPIECTRTATECFAARRVYLYQVVIMHANLHAYVRSGGTTSSPSAWRAQHKCMHSLCRSIGLRATSHSTCSTKLYAPGATHVLNATPQARSFARDDRHVIDWSMRRCNAGLAGWGRPASVGGVSVAMRLGWGDAVVNRVPHC